MTRHLLHALGFFAFLFTAMIIRSFIFDRVLNDREWSLKKEWKFGLVIASILAIAFFVYLRVMEIKY